MMVIKILNKTHLIFYSMERQLVEFQSLLQQKDEQIAQLMEEGKVQVITETDQH
jgi:hypothetical protein